MTNGQLAKLTLRAANFLDTCFSGSNGTHPIRVHPSTRASAAELQGRLIEASKELARTPDRIFTIPVLGEIYADGGKTKVRMYQ